MWEGENHESEGALPEVESAEWTSGSSPLETKLLEELQKLVGQFNL